MSDLRHLLEEMGLTDVTTYLQSGNAVFTTDRTDRVDLRAEIEEVISRRFSFSIPVLLATKAELEAVIEACPYLPFANEDPTKVHVMFVDPMPSASVWSSIDQDRLHPEEMTVGDGVVYMSLPNGMGRAALPALVAKAATGVTATTRNWRTVVSLESMLAEQV